MTAKPLVVVCLAGFSRSLIESGGCPAIRSYAERFGMLTIEPVLPAVTLSMQATLTTGRPPAEHGIVGNGYYDRTYNEHRFWTASSGLLDAPRVWEGGGDRRPRVAALFWWNFLGADLAAYVNVAPFHLGDGTTVTSCYSDPPDLYAHLERELGPFPLHRFWGPGIDIESSRWILQASLETARRMVPDLLLTYLPHMDYSLQRSGPGSEEAARHLGELDALLAPVLEDDGGELEVAIVSDYGITPVTRVAALNRELKAAGLFRVRMLGEREYPDLAGSRVFAICDHQIAHIYVRDPADRAGVRERLEGVPGVDRILDTETKRAAGVDHPRAGDLVAVAAEDAWFEYGWWTRREAAPDYAFGVDIHRKIGYDPLELIADPAARSIASDPGLIRGSHGGVPADSAFKPLIISRFLDNQYPGPPEPVPAAGAATLLMNLLERAQGKK